MRALSFRQAASCEAALSKRCRCRCGGAFHGTLREVGDLRQGDPHALKDAAPSEETEELFAEMAEAALAEIEMSDEEAEQLRWEAISREAMQEAADAARGRAGVGS
jgi:hypothetical protein